MSEIGKYIVVQKRFQHKLCIKRAIGIRLLQNEFLIITYEFDLYFAFRYILQKLFVHDIKKFF